MPSFSNSKKRPIKYKFRGCHSDPDVTSGEESLNSFEISHSREILRPRHSAGPQDDSKCETRVGIDGGDFIPFGKVNSGIKRIVDSFLKGVCKLKNDNFIFNYYYFSPVGWQKWQNGHPTGVITYKRLPQKLFASLFLPLRFLVDGNNVFLGFSGYLPALINLINVKKVVFLYDLGFLKFPQFYVGSKKLLSNTFNVVQKADKIIVLSDYAKRELIDKFRDIDERKIIRILPGIDHFESVSINQLIDTKLTKYFLYVGVIKPIKNIEALFKYFYRFLQLSSDKEYRLILIGVKESSYFNCLLINRYYKKIKNKVIFLDFVSDKELVTYYLKSTAVINMSYEEGFCFPVLEALSLGKTAIVNDLSIYKEFKDKFDNLLIGKNEKEIVQLMINTAKNFNHGSLPDRLSRKNIFSWKNFTEKLLEIIVRVHGL